MKKEEIKEAIDLIVAEIKKAKRIVVVSHVGPEADAVGSLLGMTLSLREMGKEVVPYLEDPVPALCKFLPGSETITHSFEGVEAVDLTIAVDCGQLERLGKGLVAFEGKGTVLNLDHHRTNDYFGKVNLVLPDASAAGEIVYEVLKAGNLPITKDVAVNLFSAMHTDTGSFRYASASADAFRKAGELVAYGVEPELVSQNFYENLPLVRVKMLAKVLATLEVLEGGKLAILHITQEMLDSEGATRDVVDGFVDYARSINGVEVGVLIRQAISDGDGDSFKVSFRSKGRVDVSKISERFGGGGHSAAAGCLLEGTLKEVREIIVKAVNGVL